MMFIVFIDSKGVVQYDSEPHEKNCFEYRLDVLLKRLKKVIKKITTRKIPRRMVTVSQQRSLSLIHCCADMDRKKEHSIPPSARMFTGFSPIGFLAHLQEQNGPKR